MNISIKNCFNLYLLIILSFLIRVVAVYYFGDDELENEWSILFKSLYNHGVLSIRSFDGNFIPTAFMPPLYVFFIFFLKVISPENIIIDYESARIVLTAQIILSTVAIFLFYKLNNFLNKLFKKNENL